MSFSPDKSTNQFLKMAERTGWTIEHAKGGHLKLTAPNGGLAFAAKTPSDNRAFLNMKSDMRKVWPEWVPEEKSSGKKAKATKAAASIQPVTEAPSAPPATAPSPPKHKSHTAHKDIPDDLRRSKSVAGKVPPAFKLPPAAPPAPVKPRAAAQPVAKPAQTKPAAVSKPSGITTAFSSLGRALRKAVESAPAPRFNERANPADNGRNRKPKTSAKPTQQ